MRFISSHCIFQPVLAQANKEVWLLSIIAGFVEGVFSFLSFSCWILQFIPQTFRLYISGISRAIHGAWQACCSSLPRPDLPIPLDPRSTFEIGKFQSCFLVVLLLFTDVKSAAWTIRPFDGRRYEDRKYVLTLKIPCLNTQFWFWILNGEYSVVVGHEKCIWIWRLSFARIGLYSKTLKYSHLNTH